MLDVVIVDDELLAIEHIVRMIDWEDEGYRVARTFTNPLEAGRYCRESPPDILIVDIKMPLMDGLDFCKSLQELPRRPQIIILTAYRDFAYAQQAIRLGISSFLIKHECHREDLLRELERVTGAIAERSEKDRIVKRQLLRDLLKGKEADPAETAAIFAARPGATYVFLLIRRDLPYPILPVPPDNQYYAVNWHDTPLPPEYGYIATTNVGEHQWGMLLEVRGFMSQRVFLENTYAASYAVQNTFQEQYLDTVSIAFSDRMEDLGDLVKRAELLRKKLEMCIYYGRSKLFTNTHAFPSNNEYTFIINAGLERVEQRMRLEDLSEMKLALTTLFANFIQEKYGPQGIRDLCNGLVLLLDRYRGRNFLESLSDRVQAGTADFSRCYTIQEIQEWFLEEFETAVFEANRLVDGAYSAKVQEIIKFLRSNYGENYTIQQLGDQFRISSDYLRHIFKQETGQTILNFITIIKMEKAKELLRKRHMKIYQVAEMTGYSTAQYFSYVFKKVTGTSPTEYANHAEDQSS